MTGDLDEFPWTDPADPGYEVDTFDPDRDAAPQGAGDDCTGDADG